MPQKAVAIHRENAMPSSESPRTLALIERSAALQLKLVMTSGLVVITLALSLAELRYWIAGDSFAGTQLLAELLIFGSALTASVAGFAFSAFAGGGLAYLFEDPVLAVKVLALCSVVIQGYCVVAIRRSIQWRRLLPFVAGGAITVPFAVHWLVGLSSPMFAFGLGVFLIAYGVYMLARRPRRRCAAIHGPMHSLAQWAVSRVASWHFPGPSSPRGAVCADTTRISRAASASPTSC